MRNPVGTAGLWILMPALLLAAGVATSHSAAGAEPPPAWAYPVNPPGFVPRPDDGVLRHVPGSAASYSLTQLRDVFVAPVWHPGDHPALPPIVAHGRKPNVFACGCCHRADGSGGPENAGIDGLPAAYIVDQIAAYKSGTRRTSVPQRLPPMAMMSLSKDVTDAEVRAAAAYFSGLTPRQRIRVVETDSVPKTFVAGWFLAASEEGGTEALGRRIVEVPENLEQFESRDTRSRFIAYVPAGAVARGAALVGTGGGGVTQRCATCHGPDLRGAGRIPPIAGRSPSYIVRQLYDLQHGARAGGAAQLMKPTVARLSVDDMLVIAAYLASRTP